jgi:signal transduction histidine kinase
LWLAGDFADGLEVSSWLVPIWNAAIRLIFYDIFIRMLVYVRSAAVVLERRVAQRTADLRKEIAERTRLERELLAAGERERQRLGYDLHDGLGQHLTGTALFLQVLKEKLSRRGLPEASEAAKAVTLIEEGIELSHQLAKGLQPVDVQAGGLMQALQDFATATENLFKIACRFECESPVLISDIGTADHLYRIVQEATSNAIKHGRATLVIISLEATDEGTFLRIADNGRGLPRRIPDAGGMGMRIMEQRAKLIGARISFVSREGEGTVVTCSLQSPGNYEQSRVAEEA